MPGTLDILRSRWQENVDQLRALEDRAATEDRELTEAEQANSQMLRSSVDALTTRIQSMASLETSVTGTNELLRNLPVHTPNRGVGVPANQGGIVPDQVTTGDEALLRSQWPTPGDYMHDIIHANQGDLAAQQRVQRALQNSITSDMPGIVPEPIVGDVINIIDASRPLVTALRSYTMPQYGASFTRPKVVSHTIVGEQVAQKTELPSRKFTVNPLPVNKMTLGGAIDVAFQVIDWTQPSALNAITTDLADQYSIQTEAVTAGLIHTAATVTNVANAVTVAADTSGDWIAGIADAAAKVFAGVMRMPDMIACSPDVWARLVAIVDTTGRPIMAAGAPQNSAGTLRLTQTAGSILGLPLVVSPGFPTGTLIVMASSFAEVYEDRRGALRVVEPKLLGWEIAYYGYFAGLVTEAKAFVQVIPPA
jgi:HK97 family phage major capsid protein